MCPLIENLGPNIEGQPCWPAITCSAGWFRSCTCGFAGAGEPLRWSCGGTFDLSVPDLSPPADLLALPDSGATD